MELGKDISELVRDGQANVRRVLQQAQTLIAHVEADDSTPESAAGRTITVLSEGDSVSKQNRKLSHKFQFVEPLMKQDHGNNRAVSEVYPEKPDIPHFQMATELTSVSSSSSSSSR